jgi:hypothetical protein
MKRKMRKFADGGFSTAEGENKNISDDIRARALRSVMPDDSPAGTTGYGEQNDLPETKTVTKTTVSKTPAKPMPKGESADEYKTRMESLVKKQALERVTPEETLIGGGGLKVLRMAGKKLADKIAAGRTKTYTQAEIDAMTPKLPGPSAVKQLENKATKMLPYDKAGDLASKRAARATARDVEMKRGNARNYGLDPDDLSTSTLESLRKNIGAGEFTMKKGGKVKAKATYKSGGSVKSSASRRADGCALRGKTRA